MKNIDFDEKWIRLCKVDARRSRRLGRHNTLHAFYFFLSFLWQFLLFFCPVLSCCNVFVAIVLATFWLWFGIHILSVWIIVNCRFDTTQDIQLALHQDLPFQRFHKQLHQQTQQQELMSSRERTLCIMTVWRVQKLDFRIESFVIVVIC